MEDNKVKKLRELVSRSRVGMLGTLEQGFARFRPMSHVDIDDEGKIWFFTSKDSWKAAEIEHTPSVQLIYMNEGDATYIRMDGMAYITEDHHRMKELFNPFVKAWFPKGLKDPSLSLLVFTPVEIEYWKNDDSKAITYLKILAASALGKEPSIGEHDTVALQ